MKLKNILFTVFLLINLSFFAQKKTTSTSKKPASIYTFSKFSIDKNSFSALNKKLNLKDFNFVFVDIIDSEFNEFTLDVKNSYKEPSEFIYDNLKRYQNNNLLKGFLLKNDPTRWNFHCPSPLSVKPRE